MNILLIEDDKDLCQALSWQLEQEHHTVDCCYRGDDARLYLKPGIYDLILLDCMLPGIDGLKVLKQMRADKNFTPVIILSALGEVGSRVNGLNMGADDYLVKPFAFSELMARINSLFRRKESFQTEMPSYGDLVLDPAKNELFCADRSCKLSQTEGELITLLLRAKGNMMNRTILLHKVWGLEASVEDGNLDNYIYFLRKRLKTLQSRVAIKNQRGTGYYLEET